MINYQGIKWANFKQLAFEKDRKRTMIHNLSTIKSESGFLLIRANSNPNIDFSRWTIGYLLFNYKVNHDLILYKKKSLYLGINLIQIPENKFNIDFFLQFQEKYNLTGKFTINFFKPTTQVIINPITNQPVVLGQESLNAIQNIVNQAI